MSGPRVTTEQARRLSESLFAACVQIGVGEAIDTSDVAADLLDARAEIATLRAKLDKVCEAGEDLRNTAFCDVLVALDCPRGDCDCCTCEAVGKFDAALAAAREGK